MVITQIHIQGLVQGVGFRPFIYLLAKQMGLKGTVANTNDGVVIRLETTEEACNRFVQRIQEEHPVVAAIHHIHITEIEDNVGYKDFEIIPSQSLSDEVTQVAPDIAVCADCLHDRQAQAHRIGYPFINCTHCGPRFSIIKDLPYDRKNTTMAEFIMCPDCQKEYTDIYDRRFHAQPVACNYCGPVYYATYDGVEYTGYEELLALSVKLLSSGKVIAAKGIGGYHLICDATNEQAVNRLREVKHRDTKPFAVMFRDEEYLRQYTQLNDVERESIMSWRRPIVLLKQHKALASGINPGMNTLGCMLPYMPLHYDWFKHLSSPALVMTSGNLSELPIVISPDEAEGQFGEKVDLILHHNRIIHNRIDDSILHVCADKPCLIRRSRGYVPEPFFADVNADGILAFGAEKVNTFALGKGDTVIQSQYIGDLKSWETLSFYKESLERFRHLFRFSPKQLACDLHPDYMSSREAEEMALAHSIPLQRVQHHHAHAAACMLEYGIHESVIAVVWDGTGLGDDGKIWGGEFFLCDKKEYTRLSHLEYVPMPGGDKASDEAWRMAVSYLYHYGLDIPQSFIERLGHTKIDMLKTMIDKGINVPLTSGAGRLFDALSSLLGLCDVATRQAEAPVLLEQSANNDMVSRYTVDYQNPVISSRSLFEGVLRDLADGVDTGQISAKVHNSLAYLILEKSKLLLSQTGTTKVVLSGGCFQNKRLTEQLHLLFSQEGIPLYIPCKIPCNDSGIAAGQLAVAASRRL
ncbi:MULTISPECIES: carbamoyltransferase HypF [unclassified Dysgonomonas]|uniref:carbamoyltransferase HypF n=1 Tax=unclassified Dysgonomonas TaxID=2630389 RepID=UPI0024755373|nr:MULTISPECIES: carbamoyltransferase HypF [unclassified Dysgonomonas]